MFSFVVHTTFLLYSMQFDRSEHFFTDAMQVNLLVLEIFERLMDKLRPSRLVFQYEDLLFARGREICSAIDGVKQKPDT